MEYLSGLNPTAMKFLTAFLFFVPLALNAQYTHGPYVIRGIVLDSATNNPMPGVNIAPSSQSIGTVSDRDGRFVIESSQASVTISVSFIGFVTQSRVIHARDTTVIRLAADVEALRETDHYIKSSLSAGYYGDITNAPAGFIANWRLQSIGRTEIGITTSVKYWKEKPNEGFDALLSKQLYRTGNFGPTEIILGHKAVDYDDAFFKVRQTRMLLSFNPLRAIAIDAGSGYNILTLAQSEHAVESERYFSGLIGISKIFTGLGPIGNAGIRASIDYGAGHLFYEAGAYRWFYIPKLPAMAVMARYYNYDTFDGVMISLRISFFSTEYYCCSSWSVYSAELAGLR